MGVLANLQQSVKLVRGLVLREPLGEVVAFGELREHKHVGAPRPDENRKNKCLLWIVHILIVDEVWLLERNFCFENL